MRSKSLIVLISLLLTGHAACMASGVWQNAVNTTVVAAEAPVVFGFNSVAPMQSAGTSDLFHTTSFSLNRFASGHNYNSLTFQTMSLSAWNLGDGMTADEALEKNRPRRVIQPGDDDPELKPGDELGDPSLQPIGEVPVLLLIILAAMVTYLRARKLKAAQVAPVARETQDAITA